MLLLKNIYLHNLPYFVTVSTIMGVFTGLAYTSSITTKTTMDTAINLTKFTGLGLISGFVYPLSFPVFGGYLVQTCYRFRKSKTQNNKTD